MISGKKVKVVLQKRTRVSDSKGGSNDIWTDTEEFKAVLSPIRLDIDNLKYNKEVIEGTHVLYTKSISSTISIFDRITYEGRIFQVKASQVPMMITKTLKLILLEIK